MNVTKTSMMRFLSVIVTLCLVFTMFSVTAFAEDTKEAKIEDTEYKYLSSAVKDMLSGLAPGTTTTISLLRDVEEGKGINVIRDPAITNIDPIIDFAGHTYKVTHELAGDPKKPEHIDKCLRVFPKSDTRPAAGVTIKNGTLTSGAPTHGDPNEVRMIIQNWGSITVENMVLDGRNFDAVPGGNSSVFSNNSGPALVTGDTKIFAGDGQHAFDVRNNEYTNEAEITIENVEMHGQIMYDCKNYTKDDQKLTLKITGGTFLNDDAGAGGIEIRNLKPGDKAKIELSGGTFSYKYQDDLENYVVDGKGYYDLKPVDGRDMYRIGDLHSVKFEMNSHGTNPGERNVAEGNIIEEPAAPVEQGWTFEGWYSDAAFNNVWTFATDTVTGPTILYAKWQKNPTYTVTFDVNGHGTAPAALNDVESGKTISAPVSPAFAGYTFDGWYKEAECTHAWDFGTDTVTGDITLYAKWTAVVTPVKRYTITFNANGYGTDPVTLKDIESGKTISAPTVPDVPGYKFGGWYKEAECINAFDFSMPITGDITLYAKWTKVAGGTVNSSKPTQSVSPKTGDTRNMLLWRILLIASFGGAVAICLQRKIRNRIK